jgi:hypothetical protein
VSVLSTVRRRRVGMPMLLLLAGAVCAVLLAAQSASAEAGGSATTADEQAEAFTACMRSHGVPDFPGITISADGQVQLLGGGVNPISESYRDAVDACEHLLPEGSRLPSDPEPQAPADPGLSFSCSGDGCPAPPERPARPR